MLSNELKEIYSSNPQEKRYYDTIEIYHPAFTKTYYFVADDRSHTFRNYNGQEVTFEPFGFTVKLPAVGENQQDLQITLDNTNMQLLTELNNASTDLETPISLVSSVYIDGSVERQTSSYKLKINSISGNNKAIVATASSTDTINIIVPKNTFNYNFPGLFI